jgi:serine/threonine protein kinase
VGKLG